MGYETQINHIILRDREIKHKYKCYIFFWRWDNDFRVINSREAYYKNDFSIDDDDGGNRRRRLRENLVKEQGRMLGLLYDV